MATISSPGVGTNGLDVKSIISQLVTLEKRPLDTLKLQAATVNTKISAFGQIKSLVSTLQDAAGKLTSVTGWNGVATTSSDSKFVSATAVGGTLPTTFSVEVQSLAKAQATASAALLPVGGALGSGTLRLELGKWSVAPASFTPGSGQPVDITISASDKLSDVASKINGANAGVTASVLSDASGERLLLRSKSTGEEFGFRLSVMEDGDTDPQSAGNTDATGLSRLVNGATVTQAAADAKATVNGIAVSSATNTFASTISGVTFKAEQVTTAPIDITVSKDNSAIQSNIDGFVKAYNAINQLLQGRHQVRRRYQVGRVAARRLDGRSAAELPAQCHPVGHDWGSVLSSGWRMLALPSSWAETWRWTPTKLTKALSENPDDVKNLFRNTGGGSADGIAVKAEGADHQPALQRRFLQIQGCHPAAEPQAQQPGPDTCE